MNRWSNEKFRWNNGRWNGGGSRWDSAGGDEFVTSVFENFNGSTDDPLDTTRWGPLSEAQVGGGDSRIYRWVNLQRGEETVGQIIINNAFWDNVTQYHLARYVGDFEVETISDLFAEGQASVNQSGLIVSIAPNEFVKWVGMWRRYTGGINCQFRFRYDDDGANNSFNEVEPGGLFNRPMGFKIKRVGDQVTGYYNAGAGWVQVGAAATWVSDDCYIGYYIYRSSTSTVGWMRYNYDSLRVSGQAVLPEGYEDATPEWTEHFTGGSNNKWLDDGFGSWDGTKWNSEDDAGTHILEMAVAFDIWYQGFRPTKMRVTFTGQASIDFELYNDIDFQAGPSTITSLEELPITFGASGDFLYIYAESSVGAFSITNIEFYE